MSLVGRRPSDLHVTITADITEFEAAISDFRATIKERQEAFARLYKAVYPIYLGRQRHRSRLITRRKQRRNW